MNNMLELHLFSCVCGSFVCVYWFSCGGQYVCDIEARHVSPRSFVLCHAVVYV